MSKLLYVKSSPRKERSNSIAAADAFVGAYQEAHPGDQVVTLDLFTQDLPPFDGFALNAKYAILHGQSHSDQERAAWKAVEEAIQQFTSADKYVFAVPMWNFFIPYRLKHYLDVIVQPSYTFSFSPEEGYKGLVSGKPVMLICARGGEYPPGTEMEAFDFQTKYLKTILGFIGLTDVRTLLIEPTLASPETAAQKREAAISKARKLAKSF